MKQQNAVNNGDVRSAIAKSAEGFPLLGHVIYWTISDFRVNFFEFVNLLDQLEISRDVADAPRAKSALIKALKEETSHRSRGSFHRNVLDNKNKASFAMVSTQSVDAENVDVNFHTETKVVLDKFNKTIRVEGVDNGLIQERFEEYKNTYTEDRFRNVVLKIIFNLCEGISVRERGGVYFIPAHKEEMFAKLQMLFAAFEGCSLDILPVINTQQARGSMWKSLVGDIREEMVKFAQDIGELQSKDGLRGGTLETRLKRYRVLKDKVENYEILFGGTLDSIKAELGSLEAEVRKMIAE